MAEEQTPAPEAPEVERRTFKVEYTIKLPRSPKQTPRTSGVSFAGAVQSVVRSSGRMRPL